jgi:hypothetical protein
MAIRLSASGFWTVVRELLQVRDRTIPLRSRQDNGAALVISLNEGG